MTNNHPEKIELRKTILEKRLALSPEKIHHLSQQIQEHIMKSPEWQRVQQIGLYAATKNEVETKLLFMSALEKGATVYFPRVEQGIRYYEVRDPEDLQKGAWGILEPKHGCTPLDSLEKLDLIVVPGVVFDKKGHRLGYGKGFYDILLENFSNFSVGLAYDFQVIELLPIDVWDQRVKRLVTEVHEYHCDQ